MGVSLVRVGPVWGRLMFLTQWGNRSVQFLLVAIPLSLWFLLRNHAPWGDEEHFVETVRLFGAGLSVDLLRSYPEMSAPLTYLAYAGWGHLVGFGLAELRLLSPLVAAATALAWFAFLRDQVRPRVLVWLTLATLVLNPYFLGLSVFVFTDMFALLGLSLVALGVSRRWPLLTLAGVIVAVCSRQYFVFVPFALLLAAILASDRRDALVQLALPAILGLLPLGLLVLLWGGLAPANELRDVYASGPLRFDAHTFSLYLAAPALYLAPLALLMWLSPTRGMLVAAGLAMAFVIVFPIQVSPVQIMDGILTVGFLHRAIEFVVPGTVGVFVLFPLLAAVNAAALGRLLIERGRSLPVMDHAERFLWCGIVAFLIVMPFSYMPWEKYALPLFMLQAAAFARFLDRWDGMGERPGTDRASGTATSGNVAGQVTP